MAADVTAGSFFFSELTAKRATESVALFLVTDNPVVDGMPIRGEPVGNLPKRKNRLGRLSHGEIFRALSR
jgi:hypothetical protein